VISVSQRTLRDYVLAGLWALPIYGLANFVGTLSSQPNYNKNFPAYARYITTAGFRASHLAASLLGNGIGLLGFTALFIYLASRGTPGVPVAAFVATILGIITIVATIGLAAFAQPAIGNAFLAGHHDVIGVNSSVYGTVQNVSSGVGIVLWVAGAALFAVAISRSQSLPTAAGVVLAVSIPVFAIGSIMGNPLAQIGGLLQIGSTIWIARSAMTSRSDSLVATLDQEPPVLAPST
jgi:hypothetical protein